MIGPHESAVHGRKIGFQPGPVPRLSEIPSEPGTPFAQVERFERRKLFLGKYILGILQDHDVNCTSFVLPCTQGHTEFRMTFRGCSENAKNDYSRIRTATRSNCTFLCLFIRQVARHVKQSNSSRISYLPNAPHIHVFVLHSQFGISFQAHFIDISFNGQTHPARDRLCRLESTIMHFLKKTSGALKSSVTCSPDSTFCLDASSRVVIWFSGRCPIS